jgi:four helix bundle protein
VHNFKLLTVWQRAVDLATAAYRITNELPIEERYGLVSQIRRCAVSVSANIAEGAGRGTDGDFARFIRMALGSACELETLVTIAAQTGLAEHAEAAEIVAETEEIRKMLAKLEGRVTGTRYRVSR